MKVVGCAFLLLAVSLLGQAKPFKVEWTSLGKTASYGPVGDIWTNCTKASDEGQINSVTIKPPMPKKGDTVTVEASFTLKENVTKGSIMLKAALNNITIFTQDFDLCSVVSLANLSCPIKGGDHEIEVSQQIPDIAPSGTYSAHGTITDQNGKEVACIDAKYKLE